MTPEELIEQLEQERLSWEKEHFGDDTEALKAYYNYCIQVAMGIDEETDEHRRRLGTQ